MNALAQTFADLTRPLLSMTTPGHVEVMRTSWRYSLAEVESHLVYIPVNLRVIAERNDRLSTGDLVHRRKYVSQVQKALADRLPRYLAAIRRVSEAEAEMDRLGVQYARSSYAWGEEPASARAAA